MTHPSAYLLRAIADGKRMEYRQGFDEPFLACSLNDALVYVARGLAVHVRIARPMVERTVCYPEPLRVKPEIGTPYWVPLLSQLTAERFTWHDFVSDNRIFNAGMAFATEADAAEAHKALFGGGI